MKKLKKNLLLTAIAAALLLPSSLALAQNKWPIYIAPKVMLSHQRVKDFENTMTQNSWNNPDTAAPVAPEEGGSTEGIERLGSLSGLNYTSHGGDAITDNVLGGGVAVGYDFYAAGYAAPIRTEIEFMARAASKAQYDPSYNGSVTLTKQEWVNSEWRDSASITEDFYGQHTVETNVYTLMANAYFDIHTDTPVTPYIGVGLGGAYLDTTSKSVYSSQNINYTGEHNKWNLAYNVGGGMAVDIRENIALDLGYRYSNFGKGEGGIGNNTHYYIQAVDEQVPFTMRSKHEMDAHEVTLGLRISAF
ncbi:MAG: outer membrane beta-barrel protein [Candidatus Adiutrix sp.]|jgi:opacity protein-like surface antigen|nr:outer membrane beta-barrel protein [Candidatus Adiutrix sp.]